MSASNINPSTAAEFFTDEMIEAIAHDSSDHFRELIADNLKTLRQHALLSIESKKVMFDELNKLVTDEDVSRVFKGTNFGTARSNRRIIADTVLKIAGDFTTGYTALVICCELGLIKRTKRGEKVTKKGRRYLFWSHYAVQK